MNWFTWYRKYRRGKRFGKEIAKAFGISWSTFAYATNVGGLSGNNCIGFAILHDAGLSIEESKLGFLPILISGIQELEGNMSRLTSSSQVQSEKDSIDEFFATVDHGELEAYTAYLLSSDSVAER